MRTFFLLAGTGVWCLFVFVLTLWLTFPSEELGLRLRAEIPNRLGRDLTAEVGDVSPWWVGLTASDLKLYRSGREGAELAAVFESASIAVSPFRSLLRRTPYFTGQLELLDGSLGFQVGTVQTGKKGNNWGVSDLVLWSDAAPIGDLLHLSQRLPGTLTGNVAIDIDVRGGSEGLSAADGHFHVEGSGLTLSDVEIPTVGPLGMDIAIDKVLLDGKVDKGQALFEQAIVSSSLFTLELKGTVGLREPFERSNVDVELVLSNLGEQLQSYEGFLSAAKGPDGAYHFFCRGLAGRLSVASCSPGKPSASRLGRRDRLAADDAENVDPGDGAEEPPLTAGESDEDRARRRQEIRDRLRERREQRRAERASERGVKPVTPIEGAEPAPASTTPVEEPEEPPPDEEPIDEPPPEEEEPPVE